jgi:hypothetical protein
MLMFLKSSSIGYSIFKRRSLVRRVAAVLFPAEKRAKKEAGEVRRRV